MIADGTDIGLLSKERITYLAKHYDTLDYAPSLRSLLTTAFVNMDFSCHSKMMLHQYLNDILLSQYSGEAALKYQLFKRAAKQNLVAAFEMRVQSSRVDFLTVNGVSTSYEIKSSLDNLDKLAKQAADYLQAFEFNYVVVDNRHLLNAIKMLPDSFGVLSFTANKKTIHRIASPNTVIDSCIQLNMLTKKELLKAFPGRSVVSEICNRFSNEVINSNFKETLKARYRNRWNFLVQNKDEILPIDLQFFFNRNIQPELIYQYG